ncbi:hypothetical protein, partial [Staphylococcus epidermidis]|uniref:hypothetical protein n=1 Tax=Staphylococcus epidermidis TaxID=1282 RepID=UPI003F68A7E8
FKNHQQPFKRIHALTYKPHFKHPKPIQHIHIHYKHPHIHHLNKNLPFISSHPKKPHHLTVHTLLKQLKPNPLKHKTKINQDN